MKSKTSVKNTEISSTAVYEGTGPSKEQADVDQSLIIAKQESSIKTPSVNISSRDNRGLRTGITYVYNSDGGVNWRAMLKPEHLCFNSQKADKIAKKLSIAEKDVKFAKVADYDASLYEDNDLLILLSGIKYLAWLRGYKSVKSKLVQAAYNIASVKCSIEWIGNYESDYISQSYSDGASATLDNTAGFGTAYLTETAFNRAFSRVVRNYLNINIVAKEEIGPDSLVNAQKVVVKAPTMDAITKPRSLLSEKLSKLGMPFDNFRELFIKKYVNNSDKALNVTLETDPTKWTNVNDFSENDVLTVLSILNK